jgi:hypothetical protein
VDYRKSYADQFKEYSGTSLAQGRSSTSHIPRSNVGALRSHPRRQLYQSNIRTHTGPRAPSGPIRFTSAEHIDFCPSWLGIPAAIEPDSDLDA